MLGVKARREEGVIRFCFISKWNNGIQYRVIEIGGDRFWMSI